MENPNFFQHFNQSLQLITNTPDSYNPSISTNPNPNTDPTRLESSNFVGDYIMSNGFLRSGLFVDGVSGWIIRANGDSQLNNLVLTGGTIRFGKTDFTDSTHSGYYISSEGIYFGSASDAVKLKFNIATGAFDLVGTFNGSDLTFSTVFGDGSDGDVTINADTSLSTDMYYNNLTVNSTKNLTCNGYRIFVKETLTNNGTIKANGGAGGNGGDATASEGAGGTAGAISGVGSILSGVAGVAGEIGHAGSGGTVGLNIAKGIGVNGTKGGNGGRVDAGGVPTGGNGGTITGTIYNKIKNFNSAYSLFDIFPGSVILPFYTSAGSGSGAGGYENGGFTEGGGGGSGASGGICWIAAKTIINNAGAYIQANGGNGGNGGNGRNFASVNSAGGGGGAGGSGGVVIIIYSSLTNSGTIQAAGGTGGTKGLGYQNQVLQPNWDGTDGSNGNTGTIIYLKQ